MRPTRWDSRDTGECDTIEELKTVAIPDYIPSVRSTAIYSPKGDIGEVLLLFVACERESQGLVDGKAFSECSQAFALQIDGGFDFDGHDFTRHFGHEIDLGLRVIR